MDLVLIIALAMLMHLCCNRCVGRAPGRARHLQLVLIVTGGLIGHGVAVLPPCGWCVAVICWATGTNQANADAVCTLIGASLAMIWLRVWIAPRL